MSKFHTVEMLHMKDFDRHFDSKSLSVPLRRCECQDLAPQQVISTAKKLLEILK